MRARLPGVGAHGGILLVLTAQVFIIMLGLGLATPILPLYAQSFGLNAAAVGSLITVSPPATGASGSAGGSC
jgi:hypothetical protein